MYWMEKRLMPAFESMYPGMKMILILDNAPYHHSLVEDGFRPDGMSKEDIVARLKTLKRPVLKSIEVRPYADNPPPPELPGPQSTPTQWCGYMFVDDVGEVWGVDGINDEGYGDAVVYYRVGKVKAGAVESTMVATFSARINHTEHKH